MDRPGDDRAADPTELRRLGEAREALRDRDPERAEALLMPLRNRPPLAVEASCGLAVAHLQRNDLRKCLAFACRASALRGRLDEVLYYTAVAREITGCLPEAEQAYAAACSANPERRSARAGAIRVRRQLTGTGGEGP